MNQTKATMHTHNMLREPVPLGRSLDFGLRNGAVVESFCPRTVSQISSISSGPCLTTDLPLQRCGCLSKCVSAISQTSPN